MAAAIGTIKAKVLIQIGDGELHEVGVMDIDLVAKQDPVKRSNTMNVTVSPSFDAEATAKQIARRLSALSM